MKNLLTVDIGNTNISFGLFVGVKIIKQFDMPTREYNRNKLKQRLKTTKIDSAIICSVVPKVTKMLCKDLRKISRFVTVVGSDLKVPINNLYQKPKQVGQDRLVNAFAAVSLHGKPAIIIDFGTAVTFDVVSDKGDYLGGLIMPGIKLSLDALAEKTALLPRIKLEQPNGLIGRNTKQSILSGVVHGLSAATDDLVLRIKKIYSKKTIVIATGGNAELISKHSKSFRLIDKNLTLKGLYLLNAIAYKR